MKNLLFLFISATLLFGCKKSEVENDDKKPNVSLAQKKIIESDNKFGVNIFKELHQQEDPSENIFISPLSISMALGMTLNGASGSTRTAMETALQKTGLTQTEINLVYRKLIDLFDQLDPAVKMDIANSIWYRQNFSVLPDFIQTNQQYFDAEVKPLDFDDPSAKNIINDWVKNATNGKIPEIVDAITSDHVMFLINAIYFNAFWTTAFDPKSTNQGSFQIHDGSTVTTDMMFSDSLPFKYHNAGDVEVAEFSYGKGDYSMVILLPAYSSNVNNLINNLTLQQWDDWLSKLNITNNMHVNLPKFEVEYEIELNDVLSILGMGIAFTDNADFSKISEEYRLMISKVKHKTYVRVDEEGTEAAAVTSVEIVLTSMPPTFSVNRPFVFAIREKETGSILFIGKIVNPS